MGRGELAQNVGGLVRARRKALGMSQAELATEIGVSIATVSAWERGERQPSLDGLMLLSGALRCRVSDFFPGQVQQTAVEEAVGGRVVRLERQLALVRRDIDEALERLRADGLLPELPA